MPPLYRLLLNILGFSPAVHAVWHERGKAGILEDLGPLLSADARILLRDDESFALASKRWQWWAPPDVAAVIDVKSEEDIRQTILYANKHSIPFITKGGGEGHGATSSLANAKNSIQIWTKSLNSITISPSGTSATIGAGIKSKKVIDYLWAHKKQTVTGVCECVGLAGVALGGGHGILQGRHGILSDQFISLRMILANGTAITVSEHEHPDLFWAVQGAGHNFGVVTEFEYKIYDIDFENKKDIYSYEAFVYPATKENTRKIYTAAKESMDTQPEGIFQYGLVLTNPVVSKQPIIIHHVVWNGPLSTISEHTQPFRDLEPLNVMKEEGTYLDVPRFLQIEVAGMVCNADKYIPGAGIPRFPVDLKEYNIDTLVNAVDKFTEVTTTIDELAGSFFMIEQYATQGLGKVKPEDTAVPWRDDKLLLAPAFYYPSLVNGVTNSTIDSLAMKYGKDIRQILVDGAGHKTHSYVNYAYGGESPEEVYGHEPWRLEKLRDLKRIYDPENKFRFYAPIEPAQEKIRDEL